MPDYMQVRLITRDIRSWPHRDLEHVPIATEMQVWWGDKDVPAGYITVMNLGDQKLDFGGGLDLTPHTADSYDRSLDKIESSLGGPPRTRRKSRRGGRKKTTRKKAKAKAGAHRSRGRGASRA